MSIFNYFTVVQLKKKLQAYYIVHLLSVHKEHIRNALKYSI